MKLGCCRVIISGEEPMIDKLGNFAADCMGQIKL